MAATNSVGLASPEPSCHGVIHLFNIQGVTKIQGKISGTESLYVEKEHMFHPELSAEIKSQSLVKVSYMKVHYTCVVPEFILHQPRN